MNMVGKVQSVWIFITLLLVVGCFSTETTERTESTGSKETKEIDSSLYEIYVSGQAVGEVRPIEYPSSDGKGCFTGIQIPELLCNANNQYQCLGGFNALHNIHILNQCLVMPGGAGPNITAQFNQAIDFKLHASNDAATTWLCTLITPENMYLHGYTLKVIASPKNSGDNSPTWQNVHCVVEGIFSDKRLADGDIFTQDLYVKFDAASQLAAWVVVVIVIFAVLFVIIIGLCGHCGLCTAICETCWDCCHCSTVWDCCGVMFCYCSCSNFRRTFKNKCPVFYSCFWRPGGEYKQIPKHIQTEGGSEDNT